MSLSLAVLIFVNILPIYGVLYAGWNLDQVMIAYWFENVVIGVGTLFKMSIAKGSNVEIISVNGVPRPASKRDIMTFFAGHYGTFTAIHGVFVLALYHDISSFYALLVTLLPLAVSHVISYFSNYVGALEYERVSPSDLLFVPYKRVVPLHLTLILGAFFASTQIAIIILIVCKIIVDASLHFKEHKKIQVKLKVGGTHVSAGVHNTQPVEVTQDNRII